MKATLDYIINTFIVLCFLFLGQILYVQAQSLYYAYAPIDLFYKNVSLTAENACTGDTSHLIHSIRYVYGTEIGYGAEVVREMYLFKGGQPIKILEEHAMPFIETRIDGAVTRQQPLPSNLKEGEYQWIMYLTLVVHGVQRKDIPPIESNVFSIKPCI